MDLVLSFLLGVLVGAFTGIFITASVSISRCDDVTREKEDQLQLDYLKEYNKKHNKNITKTGF